MNFDTKEYTLELLHSKFNKVVDEDVRVTEITIPFYQRGFVWKDEQQSKFIESIFLGLPIPPMFFVENEEGVLEVVDGSQRIRTINRFLNNDLKLKSLEKIPALNGLKFDDFNSSRKRKFKNVTLRAIVLFDLDENSLDISHDLFDRLNTGGTPLTNPELIRGSQNGKFINFIFDTCSKNDKLDNQYRFNRTEVKRAYKEEFIIKYFAFSESMSFSEPINRYIDDFIERKNTEFENPNNIDRYKKEFEDMLDFIEENNLIDDTFREINKKNRILALYIGVTKALRSNNSLTRTQTSTTILSKEFKENAKSSGFAKLKNNVDLIVNSL